MQSSNLTPPDLFFTACVLELYRLKRHKLAEHQDQRKASMSSKPIKIPGPDHPITIQSNTSRVVVCVAGLVVADTHNALTMREGSLPVVQYIPFKDVDTSLLQRTSHATYCPYKGDCAYYSIPAGGERSVNAVWTYETPYAAVAEIKGHLAFYPSRVDTIEVR
jgi:uncharacterized protein (DUF427 family)